MNDRNHHFRYKDFTNHPDYKAPVLPTEENKITEFINKYLTLFARVRKINFSFPRRQNGIQK
jgi:hypothetical protein